MASVRDQVLIALDHVAHSLDGLERPVMREVLPVLKQAHGEVQAELRAWIAKQDRNATFTAQRYRNVLVSLRHAFELLDESGETLEDALKAEFRHHIGPLSVRNLQREWEKFGHIFEGTVQPLPLEETVILAKGKRVLWKRFESSARRYAGEVGERARFHLAVSRARGETIQELTNRMERHLPDVFRSNRWDAERLARTETMGAYNQVHRDAIEEAHKEDPELRERWDATYDFRRCPMCASIDGQVIDPTKGEEYVARWFTKSKKGARQHVKRIKTAPAHPCCRCSVTIWRESWARYSRRDTAPDGARLAA